MDSYLTVTDFARLRGFPVFEGINKSKVYGHLRGHHLIPWQKKITVVDGMICLCQSHHMIHHAKEVLLKVSRSNKIIDVIVNTQYIGKINTIKGHDVADYILENRHEIELTCPHKGYHFLT